jgi:hypothetical protein
MTRNSQRQITRALVAENEASQDPHASSGRFLEEVNQNTTDQTLGFLYYWASFLLRATNGQNPLDALEASYLIKANFNGIGPLLQHTIDVFTIKMYAQLLALRSETTTSGTFNHARFLKACTNLQKFITQKIALANRELERSKVVVGELSKMVQRAHSILEAINDHIGRRFKEQQGSLSKPAERAKMVAELRGLVSQINYDDLYAHDFFATNLIEQAQQVCLRRFVITAPRDNLISEAFKFSSRHSEYI